MSRKTLAYIATIKGMTGIPGKDNIKMASFKENGYDVIAGKDDFKEGDLAAYVEYDTILPQWEEFEFLRKRCWKEKYEGFLISAMRMAGTVSYGIVFPLNSLGKRLDPAKMKPGTDLTEILKVQSRDEMDDKLAALEELKRTKKRSFLRRLGYRLAARFPKIAAFLMNKRKEYPYPIAKTDETRIESLPDVYESWKDANVDVTLKMDGTSLGIHADDKGIFSVMSRNNVVFSAPLDRLLEIEAECQDFEKWSKKIDNLSHSAFFNAMPKILAVCHRDKWISKMGRMIKEFKEINPTDCLTIQGELCGPGIQSNRMGLKELRWLVFNMSFDCREYFNHDYMTAQTCIIGVHFDFVPLIYQGPFLWKDKDAIKEYAGKLKYANGELAEGIVIRKLDSTYPRYAQPEKGMSNMASLKVISDEYALKYG